MNKTSKKTLFLFPFAFLTLAGCNSNPIENSSSSNEVSAEKSSEVKSETTSSEATKYAVTVNETEHGKVISNKKTAVVGEEVEFTVTTVEGYYVKSFTINGQETALNEDNKAVVKMVEGGLNALLTVSDSLPVSAFDEKTINKIKATDSIKLSIHNNLTVDALPLAKTVTEYDLGGNTLTVAGKMALTAQKGQNITLKNGKLVYEGKDEEGLKGNQANLFEVTNASLFVLDKVEVTAKTAITTGIYCSSTTNLKILQSSLKLENAIYGLGTNNIEGENAKILVENSSVEVTNADKDNTAFLGNVEGLDVTIKNSSFKADRQGIIARTGKWNVDTLSVETTGEYLKNETNKTKNDAYVSGAWKSGNELPASSLVLGDANEKAYNEDVTFTMKNSTFIAENNAFKLLSREDGTFNTSLTLDSSSFKNAKDSFDNGKGVNVLLSDSGETLTDLTASVLPSEGGTVSLSKTENITYGEKIEVNVTPSSGYKVSKVTLIGIDGAENDITAAMSFTAGLKNVVKVEFAIQEVKGTIVLASDLFPEQEGDKMSTQGTFSAKGFSFSFPTSSKLSYKREDTLTHAYSEHPVLRLKGMNSVLEIKNEAGSAIKKIVFTFASKKGANGSSDNLSTSDADATYTSEEKTGVWESASGKETASFKVIKNKNSNQYSCMVEIESFEIFCA